MYSKNLYGSFNYSSSNISEIEDVENDKKLLDMIPSFFHNSEYVKELMKSQSIEASILEVAMNDLLKNLYVNTATWGLDFFESELGLETDKSKSFEERRELIKAKKIGNGTVTKEMIKHTAKAFTNVEVDVIENIDDYSFIVKFIGEKGIPKNLQDFKDVLEEIKPAHLNYSLEFTYTVWDFIKTTWQGAKNYTWDSLKLYEERTRK